MKLLAASLVAVLLIKSIICIEILNGFYEPGSLSYFSFSETSSSTFVNLKNIHQLSKPHGRILKNLTSTIHDVVKVIPNLLGVISNTLTVPATVSSSNVVVILSSSSDVHIPKTSSTSDRRKKNKHSSSAARIEKNTNNKARNDNKHERNAHNSGNTEINKNMAVNSNQHKENRAQNPGRIQQTANNIKQVLAAPTNIHNKLNTITLGNESQNPIVIGSGQVKTNLNIPIDDYHHTVTKDNSGSILNVNNLNYTIEETKQNFKNSNNTNYTFTPPTKLNSTENIDIIIPINIPAVNITLFSTVTKYLINQYNKENIPSTPKKPLLKL